MELSLLHSIIGEVWKPIKGFPNYIVSNYGRIYSLGRHVHNGNGMWFRCGGIKTLQKRGKYLAVRLYGNGVKAKYFFVHRLVAEAFLSNTDNLPYVNHRDENHKNNRVENLEWCDVSYNNTYGDRLKKSKESRINSGHSAVVDKFTLNGDFIERFHTYYDAARSVGKPNGAGNVCKCCQNLRKHAYGFIWKYGKED